MVHIQFSLRPRRVLCLPMTGVAMFWLAGCAESGSNPSQGTNNATTLTDAPQESDAHAEHAHPSEGPHHGDLVELGNEEFHAEVVHAEGGVVSVYILDSVAKAAVPIDATELTINIAHDGHAEQFKLPADRDASDPDSKSSRFSLKDEELASDLDSHDATARLVVTISGKSYSGKIAHSHGAEHNHDEAYK
ncbi:MAG: hypothetical protein KDB01_10110 [Planctomycetaceae bacterium]|nr:hypothetical protein [Planctomycetaceae bacterium]